jgi:hypothetical protein
VHRAQAFSEATVQAHAELLLGRRVTVEQQAADHELLHARIAEGRLLRGAGLVVLGRSVAAAEREQRVIAFTEKANSGLRTNLCMVSSPLSCNGTRPLGDARTQHRVPLSLMPFGATLGDAGDDDNARGGERQMNSG